MTVFSVVMAIFYVFVVALLLWSIIWRVQERRLPLEQRLEKVRAELRRRESPTGATQIERTHVAGVSEEIIRDVADRDGFDYVRAESRFLTFQRRPTAE
ncbi:MAG: hypothetical protein ACRDQ5_11970 [Sciscionella sp.]